MGGRQSVPRGPDNMNETSRPTRPPRSFVYNARTFTAPLAAFTMAGLLFIYARTSIRAAKLNAQKHREADGGQINWKNESARRHGQAEQLSTNSSLLKEALIGDRLSKTPKDGVEKQSSGTKSDDDAALEKVKAGRA
ncbi:uncharacterized protein J3D65DRAFT_222070 [Phyllosticta citribraziliensis]|uniref:Uncharacterized protein n=1 Tax=Phyllosticta citribraziliensis TaxID=989973 RepID=A0ABR1M7V8_9PEZI